MSDIVERLEYEARRLFAWPNVLFCEAAECIKALRKERDSYYPTYRMNCGIETKALHQELAGMTKERDEKVILNNQLADHLGETEEQLAAMTKERDQALYLAAFNKKEAEKQHDLLLASQAREAKLREHMTRARAILTKDNPTPECNWGMLDVSSEPFNDTALQERLKQERVAMQERCAQVCDEFGTVITVSDAIRALT